METKKVALLTGALLIAGVTAFMAKNMFAGAGSPTADASAMPAQAQGPKILVATRALPVGTILGADSYSFQPWPKDLVENAYYTQDTANVESLNGTVVRTAISAGQPLTQGSLVAPGDRGFLAAALGPGMRAVTIKTDRFMGGAGFIFPGDRVDIVMAQTLADPTGGKPLRVSETILQNVRVVGTDTRTAPLEKDGKQVVKTFTSVTLEVTPRIAEKIVVAQGIGKLTLSLRSIADNAADLDRAIASGAVNVPAGTDPKAEKAMLSQIAAFPTETRSTFSTGGDISRFQRRSVPAAPKPPAMNVMGGVPVEKPKGPVVVIWGASGKQEIEFGGN
jgi:Flp pilus assembly protein CpaB